MKYIEYLIYGFLWATLLQVSYWLTSYNKVYEFPNVNKIQSMSYTPYKGFDKVTKSDKEILKDLKLLEQYSTKIRTYSIEDSLPILPIIKQTNLKLDIGIWIGNNKTYTQKELNNFKDVIENYSEYIDVIIVGNEALLRNDTNVDDLINTLIYIKGISKNHSVTTAETWHNWAKYPQLAEYCDVIYIHVLPYWESVPINDIIDYTKRRVFSLKDLYDNKNVVIGEFGFPSRGYNNHDSVASPENQAYLIRTFIKVADENHWSYNIVDAFDQQWKGIHEGSVGAYWGIFDVNGNLKFSLDGIYQYNKYWIIQMFIAIFIGFFYTHIGLKNQKLNIHHTLLYSLVSQAMSFGNVHALFYPYLNYMTFSMYIIWGIGTLMMIPLTIITLIKMNEIIKCTFGVKPLRTLQSLNIDKEYKPFVSLHIPAYKENPDVLIETIKATLNLDYPKDKYEVIVIINNTKDDKYKLPVKLYCETITDVNIKYLDIECTGFKGGALNAALEYMDSNTEVIGIIDADYVVNNAWLKDLCPIFKDKTIGIVQAPQDHRDFNESLLKKSMNYEYSGFFDIGMVERNETNSIIVHGTMLLISYEAFKSVGGWSTDTIVEDTELGLRIMEANYQTFYTNKRYGYGLLPDNLQAFKNQRHRWVFGSVQIFKKHFNEFLFKSKRLTNSQKSNYLIGWSFWFLEGISTIITFINLIWIPFMIYYQFMIPTIPLVIPTIMAFIVNIAHTVILYKTRVKTSLKNTLLSAITSMSLQLTIMKGLIEGFIGKEMIFKRTEKGGNSKKHTFYYPIKLETILFIVLNGVATYFLTHNWMGIIDLYIFSIALIIQSIPYGASIVLYFIEIISLRKGFKNEN